MENLNVNIAEVLKKEGTYNCLASAYTDQVVVQVSDADYEHRMGKLIQEIQRIIDRHCPERENNLFLIIRVQDKKESVFKIWKSDSINNPLYVSL